MCWERLMGLTGAALLVIAASASAQPYPTKPIRLIVASAPGGAPDILARTVAQKLSDSLGQQVVIDNRPGASGLIGAELAAKAAPDGYTLFLGTTTLYAILPNLKSRLPYDPVRDFVSITQIAVASNVLVVNPSLSAKSVAELVLLAKGAGPALMDVIAGQVQIIITSPIAAGPHINSGKVRALATTGAKRNPALPNLPTVAEALPGYDITQWWGISAPARTSPAVVKRLHAETAKAVNLPDVRERLSREGAIAVGGTPRAFDAFIAAERKRLGDVIRKAGIPLENG